MPYFLNKCSRPMAVIMLLAASINCSQSDFADTSVKNLIAGVVQDYCQLETFTPQCMKNEVIVIEQALYGRHKIGKCITAKESTLVDDVSYFGCHANVVSQMNAKCSGKRQCEVRVPDADLDRTRSCLPGLQMFLEVSFSCIEVVEPERSCTVLVSSKELHISPVKTNDILQCGTKVNPWIFEAPAGQRIAISLIEFSSTYATSSALTPTAYTQAESHNSVASRPTSGTNSCFHHQGNHQNGVQHGYLIDKTGTVGKRNISLCGGTGSMNKTMHHVSTSNSVELVLLNNSEHATIRPFNFLISFQAIGCTNLMPPESAWIKRHADTIVIGCYTSRQTWHLRCEEGKWIGVVSSCSDGVDNSITDHTPVNNSTENHLQSYEVAMVVAIGFVGLALCLIIVCCGVVGLQRFYAKNTTVVSEVSNWHKQTEYHQVNDTAVGKCVMLTNGSSREMRTNIT